MTFDINKYKSFSLMQLKGRWKPAIFAALITIAVMALFSVTRQNNPSLNYNDIVGASSEEIMNALQNSDTLGASCILDFIEAIVGFVLDIVLISFFLIFSRSPDPVQFKTYFDGYNKWARGILNGLWKLLWIFIWALIAIPVIIVYAVIIVTLNIQLSDTLTLVIYPIILLIGFIPMFIKTIDYSFSFFFAAEFPEIGVRKALRLSISIVKGHRLDVFLLNFSFIGWFLLCMVTFGVGFVWYMPYYWMTMINAYHALLQDALESGKIKPEDLNS